MSLIDRVGGDRRWLDGWSVLHFVGFALLIGFATYALTFAGAAFSAVEAALVAAGLGITWEGWEHWRETTAGGHHEPWTNRAMDVAVDVVGGLVGWSICALVTR